MLFKETDHIEKNLIHRVGLMESAEVPSGKSYRYDQNGNIKTLQRNGASGLIDNLSYTYNGNQQLTITDASDKTKGFKEPSSTTGNDFTYDANGNVIVDQNQGAASIIYNYHNLPEQIIKTTGEKSVYVYDAHGNRLSHLSYNATGTLTKTVDYVGEFVYQGDTLQFINHEEGRVVMKNNPTPEYQYHLRDNLGNVRLTFTTQMITKNYTAGFETSNQTTEAGNFSNYPNTSHINTVATNAHSGSNSLYLNGSANGGQVGVAKSISVMPGDVVSIQAYAKYNAPTSTPSNLSGFATALLSAFNLSAPVAGETGTARSAINAWGAGEAAAFGDGSTDNTDPKVFVNIIVFDRNYNFLDISYQQLTSSGVMNASYTTKQPGYVYVYVSNEQQYQTDVYFDDINVTFTPSPVIQQQDYYSFGGDLNKYSRESSVPNKYLYNKGSELHDDQGVQIYLTDLRDYDPWGRLGWWQIDPVADQGQESWTPYHYAYNNPISHNDPKGDCPPGTPCFGLMNLAIADAAAHPNGVGAHTLGVVQGLTNSAEGLVNAVSHPVQTMQGMGNLALAGLAGNPVNAMQMDMALGTNSYGTMMGVTNAVTNGANNLVNGNGMQRGTVLGEIGGAILGTKGINAGFGMMRGALTTASTGRVFWSGGNLAKTAAADFAKATGGKTLEMTFTGKAMNGVSPFLPRSVSGPIWNSLSRSFAKGASGSANFFTTPAGPRAGSIWSTIEKPILDQKKIPITTNVTK